MEENTLEQPENLERQDNLPDFKILLGEFGKQLSTRKGVFFKRVIFTTWPFLLIFVAFFFAENFVERDFTGLGLDSFAYIGIGFGVWILFSIIWMSVTRMIFGIEKVLWVDSYFDGKNLESQDSWRIAKKLFWPAFRLKINIFVRFWVLPIVIILLTLAGFAYAVVKTELVFGGVAILMAVVIGIAVYSYYIRIKLRYVWFLFLDWYQGSNINYHDFWAEIKELNSIYKSEAFKKTLFTYIATDVAGDVVKQVFGFMSRGMGAFGKRGRLLGGAVGTLGQEGTRQVQSFAQIAATYMFYRVARDVRHGSSQKVNEHIYGL